MLHVRVLLSLHMQNYRALEKDKIVVYTTSMMVVRETHEHCKTVRNILMTHMLEYEERDIFMSRDNQRELQERLAGAQNVDVPQVFVDGQHLGVSYNTCPYKTKLRFIRVASFAVSVAACAHAVNASTALCTCTCTCACTCTCNIAFV